MRYPRLRRDYEDTFYHCYNRVAGTSGDRPFGPPEKETFIRMAKEWARYYVVEIVAFQVLGNHFHLILHAPKECPSPEETCRRYEAHYDGKRKLTPGTEHCEKVAAKLRDVSEFMGDLEQGFTTWFNRTRPVRRRGALWAGRYKDTILEAGLAVWNCWKYVEMNPVRAGIVADPAEYRFCSFAEWSASGKHPFAETVENRVMPFLRELLHAESPADLHRFMRMEFARLAVVEARRSVPEEADIVRLSPPLCPPLPLSGALTASVAAHGTRRRFHRHCRREPEIPARAAPRQP